MIRALLAADCGVLYTAITAAPEIMAYARSAGAAGKAAGFVYISASHNPIGHNGLKFGLTDGGVLAGSETAILIGEFRRFMADKDSISRAEALLNGPGTPALNAVYAAMPETKKEALHAYLAFTAEVVSGGGSAGGQDLLDSLRQGLSQRPLGIVADLNGSARTLSIDKEFLETLGAKLHIINGTPGDIVHRIVPEGESLEPCRLFLEDAHRKDPRVILGYVPDCDGDRGNLVIWDDEAGAARILEAQEVFALACVAELASLVWTGEISYDNKGNALSKAALAVNGPTSMRIERIAAAFDVSLFRAEVGEANVVALARRLREQGFIVRILGEGSAGGTITHPSAVRDPIDTVCAVIKLLSIRSTKGKPGLFELWCDLAGEAETYHEDFTLQDVISSLPAFVTTGTYSPEAVLKVAEKDHALLKNRYQEVFLREWEARKDELRLRYGIVSWAVTAYVGIEEKRRIAHFGEAGKGGLKIIFSNGEGRDIACIWMRGSATEPVFRIMAEAEGSDKRLERDLIEWQRRMVTEADNALRGV
ncbi:phosphoglucomutase [Spirochaetia bacterium]|nr:phosphoglucomutase [Spirochaetia bacterium]